jgi:hypothetical protein
VVRVRRAARRRWRNVDKNERLAAALELSSHFLQSPEDDAVRKRLRRLSSSFDAKGVK